MKVLGALVAREMRSAAARGEEADLVRARKGWHGYVSEVQVSVKNGTYGQGVQRFCLLHIEVVWWDVSVWMPV